MARQFLTFTIFIFALFFVVAGHSFAQTVNSHQNFFVKPMVGFGAYWGDNDTGLDFGENEFPWNIGAEIGYATSPSLSFSAAFLAGNYPTIGTPDLKRYQGLFFLRYSPFRSRISPVFDLGLNLSVNNPDGVGFGPLGGAGLSFDIDEQTSFLLEWIAGLNFPDDAVDNTENVDFGGTDILNGLLLGIKFNLQRPQQPRILSIDCPSNTETENPVTFSAAVDKNSAKPVDYNWKFGDGTSAAGLFATHSFQRSGSYNVTFSASNRVGSVVSSCTVVVESILPASIVSINANPNPADAGQTVSFSATVRGDEPITYRWDFGDGTLGEGVNPDHTFTNPGQYSVTLNVSNEGGSDTQTIDLQIDPVEAAICLEITEMNVAYFDRNSSTLTDEALETLGENLEILVECPNLNVRLEGFAAPGERNAQLLTEDRVRAVEQYYARNGVVASRVTKIGRGQVSDTTSKKEGLSQYRRVDTIPLR